MSHQEKLERSEPWPDADRFARAWDAANGMRVPGAPLDEVAQRIAFECIERIEAIHAGDRTTARRLLEASHVIGDCMKEIRRLRKERDEARRWFCYECTDARAEAEKRGWDCFKGASDER